MYSVLVTSTSFQDQPGEHLRTIKSDKRLAVEFARGPLSQKQLISFVGKFDAILCGDDEYNDEILSLNKGKLKLLSKYGVGLDKIDLESAKKNGVKVYSCAGINSKSVAEHVFALLLTSAKNIENSLRTVRNYKWDRPIGYDLKEKKLLIVGYGGIGKEVYIRAKAFEMEVAIFDPFAKNLGEIKFFTDLSEAYSWADIVTLHCPLTPATRGMINLRLLSQKNAMVLINTARGGLISEPDVVTATSKGYLKAYLADVLETEPLEAECKLPQVEQILVTPHIASRTSDNILKQASMALSNLYGGLGLE